MRLLDLIIDAYLESKARKRAIQDWQNTGTIMADWYRRYSKKEVVAQTTFSFFENGIRQRKVKSYSTSMINDAKEHELYVLRIKPWLDGANFPNLPQFRETPEYMLNLRKKDKDIQDKQLLEDTKEYEQLMKDERNEPLNGLPSLTENDDLQKDEPPQTYGESFQPSERWKVRGEGSALPLSEQN